MRQCQIHTTRKRSNQSDKSKLIIHPTARRVGSDASPTARHTLPIPAKGLDRQCVALSNVAQAVYDEGIPVRGALYWAGSPSAAVRASAQESA